MFFASTCKVLPVLSLLFFGVCGGRGGGGEQGARLRVVRCGKVNATVDIEPVLQIRRENRDNFKIIGHIPP